MFMDLGWCRPNTIRYSLGLGAEGLGITAKAPVNAERVYDYKPLPWCFKVIPNIR